MSSTIERATLTAPDISCGHCVAAIQGAVGALPGVNTVKADEGTKQVQVEFDPQRVTLAQIAATMDEEGYPVQGQ
jgi:copper chaperone